MEHWMQVQDSQGYSMLATAPSLFQLNLSVGLHWPGNPSHWVFDPQSGSTPSARLLPCYSVPCRIFPD